MGRFLGITAVLGVLFIAGNHGLPTMERLPESFWLMALLPGIYILGLELLGD